MAHPPHPDDRPDPHENMPAMRARVPEHISRGVFSTGVIIMTGATEFILDFVQNLGRPHQIVARIVIPHVVMPQFADALSTNIDLYRQRFGPLPNPIIPGQMSISAQVDGKEPSLPSSASPISHTEIVGGFADPPAAVATPLPQGANSQGANSQGALSQGSASQGAVGSGSAAPTGGAVGAGASLPGGPAGQPGSSMGNPPSQVRRPTAQEVYDDLKIRDEHLSGHYANAVMIGHGPHEFSFDFITNFFPQSAVSSRVFLAAGQVARLLESLRSSWDQLKPRLGS